MSKFSIIYDLKDDFKVLCYAEQDRDGLLYVADDRSTEPTDLKMMKDRKLQANITSSARLSKNFSSSIIVSEISICIHDDDSDIPGNVQNGAEETIVILLEINENKSSVRYNFKYQASKKTDKNLSL